jgi:hypothetical protein
VFRSIDVKTSRLSELVCGKTIRLSWADGPTKGMTQEHVFHKDGTVEWHPVEKSEDKKTASANGNAKAKTAEKPRYAAERISDKVCMVSYLSQSGYTLTFALNFSDGSATAIASNEKNWIPAHGSFETI